MENKKEEFSQELKFKNKQFQNPKTEKVFTLLTVAFVVFLILSNLTASNTMNVGEYLSFSGAEFLIPFSYIVNDLLAELFGFKRTNRVVILGLGITLVFMLILFLTTLLPTGYTEYQTVFGFFGGGVIGITFASIIAFFIGSVVNALVMVKLKNKQGEKKFCLRAIISTVIAQVLDSLVFITFCCIFASPFYAWDRIWQFVFTISTIKILVELVLIPFTQMLLKYIKRKCEIK